MEISIKNFPGVDSEGKPVELVPGSGKVGDRVLKYDEVKRLYQEATQYYLEGNYPNAYRRYSEVQVAIEKILEELSQTYIIRTDDMLKAALEKRNPNDPNDKDLADIAIEYSNRSYNAREIYTPRETPSERRLYDPKEAHWLTNREQIHRNAAIGYQYLGAAKESRLHALGIEKQLEKHERLEPKHRKYRIEKYLQVISLCRSAKNNAVNLFQLKYPYDNYYLYNSAAKSEMDKDQNGAVLPGAGETVKIEGVTYDFTQNPYVKKDEAHIQAEFDTRVPAEYRVDHADLKNRYFGRDIERKVYLKFYPELKESLKVPAPEKQASAEPPGPPPVPSAANPPKQ
jgi:hypothetical protein